MAAFGLDAVARGVFATARCALALASRGAANSSRGWASALVVAVALTIVPLSLRATSLPDGQPTRRDYGRRHSGCAITPTQTTVLSCRRHKSRRWSRTTCATGLRFHPGTPPRPDVPQPRRRGCLLAGRRGPMGRTRPPEQDAGDECRHGCHCLRSTCPPVGRGGGDVLVYEVPGRTADRWLAQVHRRDCRAGPGADGPGSIRHRPW